MAALLAKAFIEAGKGFRLAEPNLGGTANLLVRPEHSFLCSGLFYI